LATSIAIAQYGLIDQISALDATHGPEFVSLPIFPDGQIYVHAMLVDQVPAASSAYIQCLSSMGDWPS
jgi:hypothetical protein